MRLRLGPDDGQDLIKNELLRGLMKTQALWTYVLIRRIVTNLNIPLKRKTTHIYAPHILAMPAILTLHTMREVDRRRSCRAIGLIIGEVSTQAMLSYRLTVLWWRSVVVELWS